ncbi:MAG: Bax inhibitor-1/YccA family protein [Trueperella sp.]|nr:Bax inhibitor-1/YccA family protein [Trueperella sp.]
MSNPVMSRNPYFSDTRRPNNYAPQQQTAYQTDYRGQYSPEGYTQQPGAFPNQPAANAQQSAFTQQPAAAGIGATTERMTYQDAMNKTAILLGTTLVFGIVTALLLPLSLMGPVAGGAVIIAFIIGMVIAFQRVVAPALAIAYAALEGIALGAITAALELVVPGIALQAIIATAIIVAVTLGLHYSGKVRTSSRGRKIVLTVMIGYLIFLVVNMIGSFFGVFDFGAWGLASATILGLPIGVVIGAGMILVAAYLLVADFEDVNTAIANGAPQKFAWTCGIAIVMTILWIYIEVLRLIAIVASSRS